MASIEDEYWHSSSIKGISFDDIYEGGYEGGIFGISQDKAAKLGREVRADVDWNGQIIKQQEVSPTESHSMLPEQTKAIERIKSATKGGNSIQLLIENEPKIIGSQEAIIQSLHRKLMITRAERFIPLTSNETIVSILLGEPYSLEGFQSLQTKKELLQCALDIGDGNAILVVVLFLVQTLSKRIRDQLLRENPVAANHYLRYLTVRFLTEEAVDILIMLQRTREAAVLRYNRCIQVENVKDRLFKLSRNQDVFQSDIGEVDKHLTMQHQKLLDLQIPLMEVNGRDSLLATFRHCLLTRSLPLDDIQKRFGLSELQFVWIAFIARAESGQWDLIKQLFTKKNWFGGTKFTQIIPFNKVADILGKNRAPRDILESYIALIDNQEQKMTLAQKYQCYQIVAELLVGQLDRVSLVALSAHLQRETPDRNYVDNVLKAPYKWKN